MVKINDEAIDLITNSDFLLAKNEIISKLTNELYQLSKETRELFEHQFTAEPKVSRGENLKGLPYLVLDYPRVFKEEDVFAFRTLFWWGNFISFTLHIKGKYLEEATIKKIFDKKELDGASLCFEGDEWNHDLNSDDYLKFYEIDLKALNLKSIPFLKISFKMELSEIKALKERFSYYRKILLEPFNDRHF